MGKIFVELSMSLDGFVTGPNDNPEQGLGEGGDVLFAWYQMGDTALPLPGTDMSFMISAASAQLLQDEWGRIGAMIVGRRTFDIAHAWGGYPPGGGACYVMTHNPPQEWLNEDSPFTFVTDGIESAIHQAKQVAGDLDISLSSANITQQALKAGLCDEIRVNIAPVLLGKGVRLFDNFGDEQIQLETIKIVMGTNVTHMRYRVVSPKS
jgi:dihydrofolate reductase